MILKRAAASVLLTVISPVIVHSAPLGTIELSFGQSFSTTDSIGKTVRCGSVGGRWVSGTFVAGSDTSFLPQSASIKALQVKAKKASGSAKTKLLTRIKAATKKRKSDDIVCAPGMGGEVTPTPTPISSNPEPTDPGTIAYFDSSKNVTEEGKVLMKIPSQLVANLDRGKSLFLNTCNGCHSSRGEPVNYTFDKLRMKIAISPMFFTTSSITDPQLADLTAYLNRFRSP